MKKGGAPRTSTTEELPIADHSLKFAATTKQRSGQNLNFSQQASNATAGNANSFVIGGVQTTKHEGSATYTLRKNYAPSRNSNSNGTVGNRTYNRLSQPPAQQLTTGGEFSRTTGGKARIDTRNTLGVTPSLGQKINSTLEQQSSGDSGLNPLQFQQKLGSVHMKGRHEANNNLNAQVSFNGPKNLPIGGVGSDQGIRASLTLTERQSKNTIPNQEYAEAAAAARGNQFATIQVGGVSKPQFSAKNGIEPITGPKAAQIQSFESTILPNPADRRSRGGGTRNINQGHSLDPNRELQHLTSPRNSKSYLTQTSLTQGPRTVKMQKHLAQNGLQRRSIDQSIKGGLSKDYYSGKTPTQAFASTLQKVQQVGQFKKTATSRQGQRRSQIKSIVQEDAPYPPHMSSNNADRSKSKAAPNQSMSLTRNTSQMRTSYLLGNDDSKKHTSSQTIQVEKSSDPVLPPQINDSTSNARKLSANRKNKMNLHGMAKNKVNLQYKRREVSEKSGVTLGALTAKNGGTENEAVLSSKHRELMDVMSEQQNQLIAQTHQNRKVPGGDFDEFSSAVSGRKDQEKNRIASEGPERQKPVHSAISMYSKTSSSLRTQGFRQKSESQQARQEENTSRSKLQNSQLPPQGASDDKDTNQPIKTINQVGKSLNSEDYQQMKTSLKHQNSNKLIKSAAINPFFNKDAGKLNEQKEQRKSLGVTSLAASNKLTERSAKDKISASGVKVRPINSRISLSKTISTALNNKDEPDQQQQQQQQQQKQPQPKQSISNRPSNTYLGGIPPLQNSSEEGRNPVRAPATATCSKKQFEMLPSTGGSDEALPKPHTSQQPQQTTQGGTVSSQTALERNKEKQEEAVAIGSSRRKSSSDAATEQMLNVNFTVPKPKENPLKDYEKAKFASKTHGLITSYAANTHQGIQRNYNEDRVSIILNMTKPASRKDVTIWPKCSYFAIYDGHGGSACADFLKDQLHLIIINQESFPKDPAQALTTGCLEAERRFIENADRQTPMHERSGSCGIVVLIVGKECYVANVGDSRAIMSADKGKKLFLLSRDHRPNEDYEVQRIVKNGGGIYQTQSIQNVQVPGENKTTQQYILGPHRVIPGRLSVSRTFGDIEAKNPKYNGKEGVVIAQPEISQFTVRKDFHDFIVLGCDGIFDRLTNQRVLDACWDTINSIKSNEIKSGAFTQKTVHEVSGAMADEIIKQAAIERSMDNLTIVVVTFDNLQVFLQDRPKPTRLENHLFQIKEVESGATSTIVQPTPGPSDSTLGGQVKEIATPLRLSGKAVNEKIEEVRTEDVETDAGDTAETVANKTANVVVSRTENTSKQGPPEKETPSKHQDSGSIDRKNNSSSVVQSKRNRSIPLVTIKQGYITRNKKISSGGLDDKELSAVELRAQNSEQPIDSKRRKNEILPKLPYAAAHMTMKSIPEQSQTRSSKIQSPNMKGVKDQLLHPNQQFPSSIDSPKPLKKSQIATYRISKTAKNQAEPLSVQLRNGTTPDGLNCSSKQKGSATKYSSAFSNTSLK